jgi:hypothetical protein
VVAQAQPPLTLDEEGSAVVAPGPSYPSVEGSQELPASLDPWFSDIPAEDAAGPTRETTDAAIDGPRGRGEQPAAVGARTVADGGSTSRRVRRSPTTSTTQASASAADTTAEASMSTARKTGPGGRTSTATLSADADRLSSDAYLRASTSPPESAEPSSTARRVLLRSAR